MTAPAPSAALLDALTPRLNKYIKWAPTPTQAAFLLLDCPEALYGGAAGGGKSVALLSAALQYVDVPGYHALLLRRTFAALMKPEALIPLSHEWLADTDAHWNGDNRRWTFPSGATLSFGYLETESDKYQYQGSAYGFIGWDELTQFQESQFKYLFSRRRRNKTVAARGVPMRTRAATNPGGEGHEWVFNRYFREKRGLFIPAKLTDNPHLDVEDYRASLAELTEVERMQLEEGSWIAAKPGDWFKREWWQYVDRAPPFGMKLVRYWDTASTKPSARNRDPDYYSGTLMGELHGIFYVVDQVRFRLGPAEAELELAATALRDGPSVDIWMAQEPGSQSEALIQTYARTIFKGLSFRGDRQTGDKVQRAKPFSAACSNGLVRLVRGSWTGDFTAEHEAFPTVGVHDDQVDSASAAHSKLADAGDDGPIGSPPPPEGNPWEGM